MLFSQGSWIVKLGREREFVEAWTEFAEWSKAELGMTRGTLLRDLDQPTRFISFGGWKNVEEIQRWRALPGFQERVGRIRSLLDSFEAHTMQLAASSE